MRLSLTLLLALTSCAGSAKNAAECLVAAGTSSVFLADLPAGISADVAATAQAGKAVEAVAKQAAAFDEQIREIAKDPAKSEEWAKVVKTGAGDTRETAHTARVATDLPAQATRLRTAGVDNPSVARVVDTASKARMANDDLAELFSAAADAVEKNGTFDDLGELMVVQIENGTRGVELTHVIAAEVEARGSKVADKVQICHRPPGNPDNSKTLEVGASAVSAHLGHGDTEGPCADDGDHGRGRDKDHNDKDHDDKDHDDKGKGAKGHDDKGKGAAGKGKGKGKGH